MPEIEPMESGDSGISGWTILAFVVVALGLLGVAAWLLIRDPTDAEVAATPSSTTSTSLPQPPTITGQFAIETSFVSSTALLFAPGVELAEGTACAGGDSGIEPGMRISVTDGDGTLVGTGDLGKGKLALSPNSNDYTVPSGSLEQRRSHVYAVADCVLEFTIPLSREAEFYTIAVGSLGGRTYNRSDTFSHLELARFGWFLDLVP